MLQGGKVKYEMKKAFAIFADGAIEEEKLTTSNPAQIQEEISADITGYRTRWKRLLVVIYDNGCIKDPYRLRSENQRLFGVSVVVVKH